MNHFAFSCETCATKKAGSNEPQIGENQEKQA
jgi:hypothetical protein